ncbi:CRAT family protein [Megaselia abdita]
MQLLTRNLVLNLTKHATKLAPVVSVTPNRNYCFKPTQRLLWFPAFPLENTVNKFVNTTKPLLTDQEFAETQKASEAFVKGCGRELQGLLERAADNSSNWLAERWLKTAYLQYRDPVVVYSSPGMTFPHKIFCSDEEFTEYTAKVIFGMLKYKQSIDENKVPVVKMGDNELDNSQFYRVFGTCRIPRQGEDDLKFCPKSKHVVVICRNHFYKLPVYSKEGKILHPEVIRCQLLSIWNGEKAAGCPIGILTSDHRDKWAKSYGLLKAIGNNKCSLEVIQSSMFTVSLDDSVPVDHPETANEVVSEQLIHGGGSKQNSGNRWFDKTIQVIVNRNGVNGFCYEHSPAEGQPIALMDDFVVDTLNKEDSFYDGSATDNYDGYEKINIETNPVVKKMVEMSGKNIDELAQNLHLKVLHYKGFGKEFLKAQKLSPDSFCQMAMQYAFYKHYKTPAAQYESAHLRIYHQGRTETIRSCSNESVAFAKAMVEKSDDATRVKLLREAVQGHQKYAKMAMQGQGVDRHLLGLKLMALENNLEVPAFFKSPGFVKSSQFRMSTSQVASVNHAFMCYGPLVDNGYGCCYNPRKNDMFFAISSWKSNSETDSDKFHDSLKSALDDMKEVLSKAGEKPKAKL